MALARIISRSHQCARELAFDLLARGYTVEIVSPDAIPDNFADLELRVESGPDNALTATVETHTGARSSSLEFVHHLKAPMRDFVRRIPAPVEAVSLPVVSIPLNAEAVADQRNIDDAVADEIVVEESVKHDVLSDEVDTSIPVMVSQSSHQVESEIHEALDAVPTVQVHGLKSGREGRPVHASFFRTWYWQSSVAFASLLLVAVALGFAVRHQSYRASASVSWASASGALASKDFAMTTAPLNQPAAVEVPPVDAKPAAIVPPASASRKADHPQRQQSSKTNFSRKSDVTVAKRQRNNDVVAPNTVVYFDHRTAPSDATKKVPRHARHSMGDGVIASTSAPDLSAKPAPKAAPQR